MSAALAPNSVHLAAIRAGRFYLLRAFLVKYQDTVPQELGEFTIIRSIGSGNIGAVYLASQTSEQRELALKIISSRHGLNSNGSREVTKQLASLAKLEHPNIVPVYGSGELGLLAYYTMEHVDGPNLDQVIRRMKFHQATRHLDASVLPSDNSLAADCPDWALRKFCASNADPQSGSTPTGTGTANAATVQEAVFHNYQAIANVIADLADALSYAYETGMVHLDIKPKNLILSRDGRLQIVDFALARLIETPGMTLSRQLLGDAKYMAPELLRDGAKKIDGPKESDHRSDVYSLGAVLYEWITLAPPFKDRQRPSPALQSQIDPVPPRQIDRRVPRDLQTICLKALRAEPEKRYQSAQAFAADLRRFAARKAIKARPIGVLGKQLKWHKQNWTYTVSTMLAGAVLGTALTFSYWDYTDGQAAKQKFLNASIDGASVIAFSGNQQETRLWIDAIARLGADPWVTNMLSGQLALFSGQPREAVKELEQGLALNPDSIEIRALLARAYLEAGQREASTELELGLLEVVPRTLREKLFLGAWLSTIDQQRSYAIMKPAYDDAPWSNELASLEFAETLWRRAQDTRLPTDCAKAIQLALRTSSVCPTNSHARAMEFKAALVAAVALRDTNEEVSIEASQSAAGLRTTSLNADQLEERAMNFLGQLDTDFPDAQATAMAWAWKGFYENTTEERLAAYRNALSQFNRRQVTAPSLLQNAFALDLLLSDDLPGAQRQLEQLTTGGASGIEFLLAVTLASEPGGTSHAQAALERLPDPVRGIAALHRPTGLLVLGKTQEAEALFKKIRDAKETPAYRHGWLQQLIRFGCDEIQEAELILAMDQPTISNFNRSEGHFLIGMKFLSLGDRTNAKKHFNNCLQAGVFTSREYHTARFILAMLQRDPSWPIWIANKT